MSKLFEEARINALILSNRFVRSATYEGMTDRQGICTQKLINLFADLARGGTGLIITGNAYVCEEGKAVPFQLGIHEDRLIPDLNKLTDRVHEAGGRIIMQLAHIGVFARPDITGCDPLVVSKSESQKDDVQREMTPEDIGRVVQSFAAAAQRARKAGFDGVQIHAAHGYLHSQFLSPQFNHRRDRYGGSLENRTRAVIETVREIRKLVGPDYPVLIKMNVQDFTANGLSIEESVKVGIMLSDSGIDAIELSGGLLTARRMGPSRIKINSVDKEAYFRSEARAFKKHISVPLILVGGIRSYSIADKLVRDGIVDYVSMSRPLIREPDLINRWKSGNHKKSECDSDNLCFRPAMTGRGIYCVSKERKK